MLIPFMNSVTFQWVTWGEGLAHRFPDSQAHFCQPPLKMSSEKLAALLKPFRVRSASQCLA